MNYIRKSVIMQWGHGNISTTPDVAGVYVLRDFSQRIVYIGSAGAGRLRERLMEHWNNSDVPSVSHFDWYQTIGTDDARQLERYWVGKYQPRFNRQLTGI
jgi:excinuclease UvrABC nuclease subunit